MKKINIFTIDEEICKVIKEEGSIYTRIDELYNMLYNDSTLTEVISKYQLDTKSRLSKREILSFILNFSGDVQNIIYEVCNINREVTDERK